MAESIFFRRENNGEEYCKSVFHGAVNLSTVSSNVGERAPVDSAAESVRNVVDRLTTYCMWHASVRESFFDIH